MVVSGKAWTGIRLKEHDELMKELPEEEERHTTIAESPGTASDSR